MEKKRRISICVLVDALGWNFVSQRGFLDDIMAVKTPVDTLLGFSSAIIPSILTGKIPAEHGHWNLFYLSRANSPFKWMESLAGWPEPLIENKISRKIIQKIAYRRSGFGGYFHMYGVPIKYLPYLDICEKRDIYQPGGISGAQSIFDTFTEMGIKYGCYNYHQLSDADIFKEAERDLESENHTFLFLYLAELDHFLHFHCKDVELVKEKLDWYERRIKALYEAALKSYEDVSLAAFSDHGMTPITSHFDLMSEIERLGLCVVRDYLPMYDSTMARFWFFSAHARKQITSVLSNLDVGRIICRDELEKMGVYFADGRYGELIFLMDPGCLIEPGFMGGKTIQGMHGFHPDEQTSRAMFMTTDGDAALPGTVTDYFKLMCASINKKIQV